MSITDTLYFVKVLPRERLLAPRHDSRFLHVAMDDICHHSLKSVEKSHLLFPANPEFKKTLSRCSAVRHTEINAKLFEKINGVKRFSDNTLLKRTNKAFD